MQKNLQKLEGRTGFGSSDLSGEEPEQESAASKIKNAISDYGQNLYDKWSKYMKKWGREVIMFEINLFWFVVDVDE